MFVKLPNFRKLRIWDKGCIRTVECRVLIIDSLRKYLNFLLNRRPSESSSIFRGWLRSYGNHYPATIRYTWLSFPGEECIADQWEHVCYSYRHILATGEHGIPQWLIGNVDTDCLQFWNIMLTDSSKKHPDVFKCRIRSKKVRIRSTMVSMFCKKKFPFFKLYFFK